MTSPARPSIRNELFRRILHGIALLLLMLSCGDVFAGSTHLADSVVRIVNYSQRGDWYTPWDVAPVRESSGSGFVIADGLVMTNAHVVSDSRLLFILLHNDPQPHEAVVEVIAHDCDLALLRPKDPSVLDNVPALEFGGLPALGTEVTTVGYPVGGSHVSSTRGVVSRIESQLYYHSGIDLHITIQTDSAINPGNSGGPVFQGDKVVGVAFQTARDLQSVGYFIPTEVTERLLRDVADGRYDGYPELGVESSGLENPAARRRYGLSDGETGVRVDLVYPDSSADGVLKEGDLIVEVDGFAVANDGSVADGNERIDFGLLVDRHQIGEEVSLGILRDGERLKISVPLTGFAWGRKAGNLYDELPRYFVYGGLVFVPLDLEMVKTFGADWGLTADRSLLNEFLVRPRQEVDRLGKEQVVLMRRLKDRVNADMAWFRNEVIESVNGREIQSLEDLVEAIEDHEGDYHFFEFTSFRRFGVLDRKQAEAANAEILERYGVVADRRL